MAACAGCASHGVLPSEPASGGFAFSAYDHLPEARRSPRAVALKAQRDLDARFPPGSDARAALGALTAAGAACTAGRDPVSAYSACYYATPGRFSLMKTDWSVIVRLDPAGAHVARIEVNRYFNRY